MAVQTIFTCLDYANNWAEHHKKRLTALTKGNTELGRSVELKRVNYSYDRMSIFVYNFYLC